MRDLVGVRAKRETLIHPDVVRRHFQKNVKEPKMAFVYYTPGKKS